jgi:hypothetical protein
MGRKWNICLIAVALLASMSVVVSSSANAGALQAVKDGIYGLQERSSFHGFLQQGASFNTDDLIETEADDQWDVSMLRSTLYGDIQTDLEWSKWTVRFRYDLEYETDYLERLQELREATATDDLVKDRYNSFDFREWFGDFTFGDRFFLRLGRQQVVWGKTDFFSGLDVVHGFDNTWRSFLEAENEQRRIPLIMANLIADIPEVDGNLQLLLRPGFDRDQDIGNRYDLFGGRWAQQPNKGFNFFSKEAALTYNLDHEEGDQEDPTYGVRWSGRAGPVEYTLNYLHTFNTDPIVNPSEAGLGALGAEHYKEEPIGALGDFIYPQVDLAGLTATYYFAPLDIVARTEILYTWDAPYNVGTDFAGGALPGFQGVIEKDTVRAMFAFDKNVDFAEWLLRSERPGFLNIQIFDTWLVDYDDDDDIVFQAGYGNDREEHQTVATAILSWYYDYDQIVPTLAVGYDVQDGGVFVIPSVKFAYGPNWRFLIEYDAFLNMDGKDIGEIEKEHGLLDGLENNDQLYLRLQYQF